MKRIESVTVDQASRVFGIMVRATELGCAAFYPSEVIAIWHRGRSVEGMAGVIAEGDIYVLIEEQVVRGFVHFRDSEVVGLFVHPDDQRKGYGTELFRFAVGKMHARPILIKATLNAVPFYAKLGCRKVRTELVRRHERDIYVERMELV